jgi:hypothetical protein
MPSLFEASPGEGENGYIMLYDNIGGTMPATPSGASYVSSRRWPRLV